MTAVCGSSNIQYCEIWQTFPFPLCNNLYCLFSSQSLTCALEGNWSLQLAITIGEHILLMPWCAEITAMEREVLRAFPARSPCNYFKTLPQLPASPPDSWPWLPPGHSLASLHRRFSQRLEMHLEQNAKIWSTLQLVYYLFSFSARVHQHASCLLNALHGKENNGAEPSGR